LGAVFSFCRFYALQNIGMRYKALNSGAAATKNLYFTQPYALALKNFRGLGVVFVPLFHS
jgi:hypothetical protein